MAVRKRGSLMGKIYKIGKNKEAKSPDLKVMAFLFFGGQICWF